AADHALLPAHDLDLAPRAATPPRLVGRVQLLSDQTLPAPREHVAVERAPIPGPEVGEAQPRRARVAEDALEPRPPRRERQGRHRPAPWRALEYRRTSARRRTAGRPAGPRPARPASGGGETVASALPSVYWRPSLVLSTCLKRAFTQFRPSRATRTRAIGHALRRELMDQIAN